jgi:hypothetical protein
MNNRSIALVLACCGLLSPATAPAQVRIAGAITGTVVDSTGLVVPGAEVQLTDERTSFQKHLTSNESGSFTFPDLNFGSYAVTVALQGFRSVTITHVIVESSRTTDLRITLEVGAMGESVTVVGATPLLAATTNTISNTLNNEALRELPLPGRSTFNLARLAPGVVTPLGGGTHFNGMPGGTINPTTDGINNSSNGFKSGGTSFFGTVPPRLGAVEEVTVETGGLGADSGAQSGVNLKFITRRGTNQYHGSAFEQYRNATFNANTYSNTSRGLPKPELRRHEYGGSFGGPLVPAGTLRNKLFVFVNFEQEYIPATAIQTNTVLTAEAEQGIFRYVTAAGEQRTANLLQIADQNGFQSRPDPTIAALLAKQRQAQQFGSLLSTNSLRTQNFSWLEPSRRINNYPTGRLDVQMTPNLAWMASWNLYSQDDQGRRQWPLPDLPVQYKFHASWWITSSGLNWTISPRTHNEFRYGIQHSGDTTPNRGVEFYAPNGLVNGRPARFTLGTIVAPPAPNNLQNMVQDAPPVTGRHYITTVYDTLTLLRGNHSITLGGSFRQTEWRDTSLDAPGSSGILGFPRYTTGCATGDPALSMFNGTTMPGFQSADLAAACDLYALLTGRLTRVQTGRGADIATGQFSDFVYRENWTSSSMGGFYGQDSWRPSPNLTVNYGLRWEFAGAPHNHTGVATFPDDANLLGPSTGLFQPGTLNGVQNPVIARGKVAAKADLVNPAPRAGFSWTPQVEGGLLGALLGKGRGSVIRGGYDVTYYDEGTNMFAATAGNNPGQGQTLDLRPGLPGFAPGGLTLQSALPPFAVFPLTYSNTYDQSIFTFGSTNFRTMKSDLRTPSVQSWNIGVQRELAKNTVAEIRYVGNRGSHVWRTYGVNEVNIFENGFLQEFKNAQRNLEINQAAGVTSFANRGLPGQVPLPIFETAFGARGSQPALPDGSAFTNGGFITSLQQGTAGTLATNLATNSNYICRMLGDTFGPCASLGFNAAGRYPINFFQANPYAIGGVLELVDDGSYTKYHGLQLQLRRRYAQGLSANVNYTLSKTQTDIWADNATQTVNYRTLRDRTFDAQVSPFDVRHVLQAYGTYDLPFGTDRRISIDNRVLDAIVGGWTLGAIVTFQTGTPFRLTSGRSTVNGEDAGVILRNGLTVEDLQKMLRISPGPGFNRYWIDPRLIGPDGRANPAYLDVPATPGEFGQIVYLRGKNYWTLDGSLNKQVRITGGVTFTVHVTATNVLNRPIWSTPGFLAPTLQTNIQSITFGQSTQPANNANPRAVYLRGTVGF